MYKKTNLTSQEIEVNLNNKPKGLYVIKVEIDNKFITNKILLE